LFVHPLRRPREEPSECRAVVQLGLTRGTVEARPQAARSNHSPFLISQQPTPRSTPTPKSRPSKSPPYPLLHQYMRSRSLVGLTPRPLSRLRRMAPSRLPPLLKALNTMGRSTVVH